MHDRATLLLRAHFRAMMKDTIDLRHQENISSSSSSFPVDKSYSPSPGFIAILIHRSCAALITPNSVSNANALKVQAGTISEKSWQSEEDLCWIRGCMLYYILCFQNTSNRIGPRPPGYPYVAPDLHVEFFLDSKPLEREGRGVSTSVCPPSSTGSLWNLWNRWNVTKRPRTGLDLFKTV